MVDLGQYRRTIDKGMAWLLQQQNADGSVGEQASPPAMFFYKSAYAMAATGHVEQTGRLLGWIRQHMLDTDGQLSEAAGDGFATYRISWISQAAHRMGWFDISRAFLRWLLARQTPCGGFRLNADAGDVVETIGTWAGMASLYMGDLGAAERAAGFVRSMIDQQPDPARFYHQMTPDGHLHTSGEAGLFIDTAKTAQAYYHLGIPMVMLVRLYLATRGRAHLDAAVALYEFTRRCAPDAYAYTASAKCMVGSAILYSVLGRQEMLASCLEMADFLVRTQDEQGWWTVGADTRVGIQVDATAEFCIFLTDVVCILASTGRAS